MGSRPGGTGAPGRRRASWVKNRGLFWGFLSVRGLQAGALRRALEWYFEEGVRVLIAFRAGTVVFWPGELWEVVVVGSCVSFVDCEFLRVGILLDHTGGMTREV